MLIDCIDSTRLDYYVAYVLGLKPFIAVLSDAVIVDRMIFDRHNHIDSVIKAVDFSKETLENDDIEVTIHGNLRDWYCTACTFNDALFKCFILSYFDSSYIDQNGEHAIDFKVV